MKFSFIKRAFTLVELIVVITILAILGTIGFVSLQGYSVNARDSVRISDTKTFLKALNIYQTKHGEVPLPDDVTTITGSGIVFSYQGTLSGGVITALGQGQVPVDPSLKEAYLYTTNETQTKFQLLSYMEKNSSIAGFSILGAQAANDYTDLFPRVSGDEVGFILNDDNSSISGSGYELGDLDASKKVIVNSQKVLTQASDFYKHASLSHPELVQFDESLIGFWDFETTQDGKLYDFSKNKTLGICYDGQQGEVDCSLTADGTMLFDGVDDYVELEEYFPYYGSGGITFFVRGKINVISEQSNFDGFLGNYCGKPKGPPYLGIGIKAQGTQFGYRDYSVPGNDVYWYNYDTHKMVSLIAIADFDQGRSWLYIDSQAKEDRSIGGPLVGESICPFRFGNAYGGMGIDSYLDGELDEIRIYNRVLSQEEIRILSES